ncbi:MAG: hypothetical protein ACEQSE_00270 [Candidatus Aquirickettsiella gammari]
MSNIAGTYAFDGVLFTISVIGFKTAANLDIGIVAHLSISY